MKLREINIKIKSLYQQLDMMRLYDREMLAQVGEKRYQELLDSTLDQIKFYQHERRKIIINDKSRRVLRQMDVFTFG